MKKIKPRFKVGDWLYYKGTYDGYLHVERIDIANDVVYYFEDTTHTFVDDYDGTDNTLRLVDDNDEKFKRYKMYIELKNEFEKYARFETYGTYGPRERVIPLAINFFGEKGKTLTEVAGDEKINELFDIIKSIKFRRNERPAIIIFSDCSREEAIRILEDFNKGDIDILVSTTVIEVGINVPNAAVMMVENAERFGLAQLHQLRGRVGRGAFQSYCIFISSNEKKETMQRLEILNKSNDGFFIASEDLKLRGPGDLFGIRQSGEFSFRIGDIYSDASILKDAAEAAEQLLERDPDLKSKENQLLQHHLITAFSNSVDFRSI